MTIKEKFNEVASFVAKCELTIPVDAGLKSGWQVNQGNETGISLRYAAYRWIQFGVHYVIMLGAVLELHTRSVKTHQALFYVKWLMYLTSWVLFGNMVQSLVGAILVTLAYRHWAKGGEPMSAGGLSVYGVSKKIVDVYCTMHCVASNFTIFMVFGYWELIGFIPKIVSPEDKAMFGCYALSVFFMLADMFAVRFPYKMATGLYAFVIMVTYLMLTWVHFLTKSLDASQKNPYIYPGLDWSKPLIAVDHAVSSVFILEVVNCSTLWWFGQLRRIAVNKFNPEDRFAKQKKSRHDTSAQPPPQQHPPNFHDPHDHQHDQTRSQLQSTSTTNAANKNVTTDTTNEPQAEKSKKK